MSDTSAMTAAQSKNALDASMATSAMSSIVNTIQQVGSVKAQGSYEQSIANTNAALGKLKAAQTLQAGDIAAARKNLETRSAVGSFRAAVGGSGVDVNKGSAAAIQSEIKTAGAMDETTIRSNAQRQAWGYETQATQDIFAGEFAKLTATSKVQQSIASGGIKAISGPLGIYGNYLRWSRYLGGGGGGSSGIVMPWGDV